MVDLHGRTGVPAAPELDCPPRVRVGQRARRDLALGVFDGALQVAGEDGVTRGRGPAPVGRPAAEVPLPVVAARPRLRRLDGVRRVEPGLPDGGVGTPGASRGLRIRFRSRVRLRVRLRGLSVFVVPSVFGAATEPEPSSPSSSQMDFRSGLSGNWDLSCPWTTLSVVVCEPMPMTSDTMFHPPLDTSATMAIDASRRVTSMDTRPRQPWLSSPFMVTPPARRPAPGSGSGTS